MSNKYLKLAIEHSKNGWYVFPLIGKHPHKDYKWRDQSVQAEGLIRNDINLYRKSTGVAADCGKSGRIVIDLDTHNGQDGVASWDKLVTEHNIGPTSFLTAKTGGGGFHLHFRDTTGGKIGNSTGKLGEGIDVRANGGYIVLPGSTHPDGGKYEWLDGELCDIPQQLVDLLLTNKEVPQRAIPSTRDTTPWAMAAMKGEINELSSSANGTRNDALNRAAFSLGQILHSLDRQLAEAELFNCAMSLGLSEKEAVATIESGLTGGELEPRYAKENSAAEILPDEKPVPHKPTNITNWKGYTLADAYKKRPPKQYVVDGVFAIPSLNIVYGSPGCMKSMLMADLVGAVLADEPWLTGLPGQCVRQKPTTKANVVWIDFDNGSDRSHERFEAVARARGLAEDNTDFTYYSMPAPRLNANDIGQCVELADVIIGKNAKLVIIDNLGTISGGTDENSTAMVPILANLRMIAELARACVIVIHHQRKSSKNTKGARQGEGLRGSTSIEAALDEVLNVVRDGKTDHVIVSSTKTRGSSIRKFAAVFAYDHKPGTDELLSARYYGEEVPGGVDVDDGDDIKNAVIEVLQDGSLNKGILSKSVKLRLSNLGVNRIDREIDELANEGVIKISPGRGMAKVCSLP